MAEKLKCCFWCNMPHDYSIFSVQIYNSPIKSEFYSFDYKLICNKCLNTKTHNCHKCNKPVIIKDIESFCLIIGNSYDYYCRPCIYKHLYLLDFVKTNYDLKKYYNKLYDDWSKTQSNKLCPQLDTTIITGSSTDFYFDNDTQIKIRELDKLGSTNIRESLVEYINDVYNEGLQIAAKKVEMEKLEQIYNDLIKCSVNTESADIKSELDNTIQQIKDELDKYKEIVKIWYNK